MFAYQPKSRGFPVSARVLMLLRIIHQLSRTVPLPDDWGELIVHQPHFGTAAHGLKDKSYPGFQFLMIIGIGRTGTGVCLTMV